jgi:hypothetical protein
MSKGTNHVKCQGNIAPDIIAAGSPIMAVTMNRFKKGIARELSANNPTSASIFSI